MKYRAKGNFEFGGISLEAFNAFSVFCNTFGRPKRNIGVVSIPGRNGDLIYDNGKYDNIARRYTFVIDGADNYRALAYTLLTLKGYQRLEDTYDIDHYMMACITDISVRRMNFDRLMVDVDFNRKPQRWLKSGEDVITITSDNTVHKINNPTMFVAEPLIVTYKPGNYAVNSQTATVVNLDIPTGLYIDCEKKAIYGGGANHNADVNLPNHEFPTLLPGNNTLVWHSETTGNKLELTPRWWEL